MRLWSLHPKYLDVRGLVAALAGCGRNYTVVGRVVVLDGEAPAITEVVGGSIPVRGTPVANATVTMHLELDDDRPVRDARAVASMPTDRNGHFRLSTVAGPGQVAKVGLEVTAAGYEPVFATYIDYAEPDEQYFLVVLRRQR